MIGNLTLTQVDIVPWESRRDIEDDFQSLPALSSASVEDAKDVEINRQRHEIRSVSHCDYQTLNINMVLVNTVCHGPTVTGIFGCVHAVLYNLNLNLSSDNRRHHKMGPVLD